MPSPSECSVVWLRLGNYEISLSAINFYRGMTSIRGVGIDMAVNRTDEKNWMFLEHRGWRLCAAELLTKFLIAQRLIWSVCPSNTALCPPCAIL